MTDLPLPETTAPVAPPKPVAPAPGPARGRAAPAPVLPEPLPDVQPETEIDGITVTSEAPSSGDKMRAGWRKRTIETDAFDYAERMDTEFVNSLADQLPEEAKQRLYSKGLLNYAHPAGGGFEDRRQSIRGALFDELAQAGVQGVPTTEEDFQQLMLARRREEWEEAQSILDFEGGGLPGFVGEMGRDIVDPINIALAPFGLGGGIVRTFAAESVIGGVAAGLGLPREFTVADDLDLPRPNALQRIGTEALASGVLGTTPLVLIRGVQAIKVRRRAREDGKPAETPSHAHQEATAEAEAQMQDGDRRQAEPQPAENQAGSVPDFDFSPTGNASPRTNRVGYVFGKLLERGMEPHIAAGFVGNFMVESGAGLNPRARGDGGFAHGIAQWNDRRYALFRFAERQGKDWTDLDVQIDFVMHELAGSEARAWSKIRNARTAAEAAHFVSKYYERPGIPHMDRRISYAQGVIDQYEGGKVPKGAATAPSSYVPTTRTSAGYTNSGQVRTAAGSRIDVDYKVVDASMLTRASGDLQPRDRSLANSDEQIANIAATLDPALLMPSPTADRGAPIVGPDNVIESGNGRFSAIVRAAERQPDRFDAYRQQIEAAGFPIPDDVRTPVLIGQRISELDDAARRRFVVEAQDIGVARMTPVERSRAEAATLDPAALSRLDPARALDAPENGDFIRAALDRLPRSERNAFVTPEGRLNADGRNALQRSLFARAWNDPALLRRFTEGEAGELKALLDALFEASPAWARLVADVADGQVRPEFDITGHVIEAMRLIADARTLAQAENLRLGNVLAELLDDIDLLDGAISPLTRALVGKFWANGRATPKDKIADFLTRYANEARKVGRVDDGLFGGPDVTDVLRAVDPDHFADLTDIGVARGAATEPGDVAEVLPEDSYAEGALSREAEAADEIAEQDLRAALDRPDTQAAREALLADGDFDIPLSDGQTVSARALLDDIDDDMALDTVMATCTARGVDA